MPGSQAEEVPYSNNVAETYGDVSYSCLLCLEEKTSKDILLKIARGGDCCRPSPAEDGWNSWGGGGRGKKSTNERLCAQKHAYLLSPFV